MSDHNGYVGVQVDLQTPIVMLTGQMQAARKELIELLTSGERRFEDQIRLLDEFQSHMRALDVLAGYVDIKGNILGHYKDGGVDAKVVGTAARLVENGRVLTEPVNNDTTAGLKPKEQWVAEAEGAIQKALEGDDGTSR